MWPDLWFEIRVLYVTPELALTKRWVGEHGTLVEHWQRGRKFATEEQAREEAERAGLSGEIVRFEVGTEVVGRT